MPATCGRSVSATNDALTFPVETHQPPTSTTRVRQLSNVRPATLGRALFAGGCTWKKEDEQTWEHRCGRAFEEGLRSKHTRASGRCLREGSPIIASAPNIRSKVSLRAGLFATRAKGFDELLSPTELQVASRNRRRGEVCRRFNSEMDGQRTPFEGGSSVHGKNPFYF